MMMQMVGAFAEFERAMLREQTTAGLDAGRQGGNDLEIPPAGTKLEPNLPIRIIKGID
jgi:DNA invertase Pin-like site-specific DNA recombinase